jgi:hypothetical protein
MHLVTAVTVVACMTACGATTTPSREDQPSQTQPPEIAFSSDLGASLYSRIDEIAGQRAGQFSLETTDQQATSALLYTASLFADNPIRRAAVWFTTGKFHVYAQMDDLTPMTLNVLVVGSISLADGWPTLALDQASVGAMRLPGFLRSWLARVATETIRDAGIRHRFRSVVIEDGRIAVSGEVLP